MSACRTSLPPSKPDEWVHTTAAREAGFQLIKRFTGGGTVVVDGNTLFATLVMAADCLPHVQCYPRPIMAWSEQLYGPVFSPHGSFRLRDNGTVWHHPSHGTRSAGRA